MYNMDKYREAKDGYEYVLTLFGSKFPNVRAKYNKTHRLYKQYKHCAPITWLEKGYISEVKKDGTELT